MRTVAAWLAAVLVVIGGGVGIEAAVGPSLAAVPEARAVVPRAAGARTWLAAAKAQWVGAWLTDGTAMQAAALQLTVADLEEAERAGAGPQSHFSTVIWAIDDFESVPISGVGIPQAMELNIDQLAVGRFFGLPRASIRAGCTMPAASPANAAAVAWERGPLVAGAGVNYGVVRQAVVDLEGEMRQEPAATTCFPAAVLDLQSLLALSPLQALIELQPGDDCAKSLVRDDLLYLRLFFSVLGAPGNYPLLGPAVCP